MPEPSKFAAYVSHSWRPHDVQLNLRIWNAISEHCELLVDIPDEGGRTPPYYVNRIEELLRRSDLFVGVLTYRNDVPAATPEVADSHLACSIYTLFEIRLAERFGSPRLVFFERKTGFKPPQGPAPSELYIAFDRATSEEVPDPRQWNRVYLPRIHQWLDWIIEHRRPNSYEPSTCALVLMPPTLMQSDEAADLAEDSLRIAGYEPTRINPTIHGNIEVFRLLHQAGIIVSEVGAIDGASSTVYGAAHAIGVPGIRTLREPSEVPWILSGHPGGYEKDILSWTELDHLRVYIEDHARAMFRASRAVDDTAARSYFQSKRYAGVFVFISHTLKPPHRTLVERVYERLAQAYIQPFEYHMENKAGADWKRELDLQLAKTTHFVVLLTEGYEVSETCTYEIEEILKRKRQVVLLPFMANGRSTPHPKLNVLHHQLIGGSGNLPDAERDAERIVSTVMQAIESWTPGVST
jgi:hypothetical protein